MLRHESFTVNKQSLPGSFCNSESAAGEQEQRLVGIGSAAGMDLGTDQTRGCGVAYNSNLGRTRGTPP